jgi:hypothetical protein
MLFEALSNLGIWRQDTCMVNYLPVQIVSRHAK